MQVFETLRLDARYLTVVRNPRNVVQSLQARNSFSAGFAYALWTTNYLDTVRNLSGSEAVVVSYEDFLANPARKLRSIADRLDLGWDQAIESDVNEFATTFVSQDLNHFKSGLSVLRSDSMCFPETLKLYNLLLAQCQAQDMSLPPEAIKKFEQIDQAWRGQGRLIESLDAHEAGIASRLRKLDQEILSQHEHLSAQERLIFELREKSRALTEELSEQSDQYRHLNNAINILKNDRNKLESIIEASEKALASLLESSRWRTGNAIGEFKRKLLARLAFQDSARAYPFVPTGNGFCLFIKRSVINEIGVLDTENFPRGYGEENDFCMRASEVGFHHLIDDSTYVLHREGSSFNEYRNALMKTGIKKVNALHPNYDRLVAAAFSAPALDKARNAIRAAFDTVATQATAVRPRVLFLAHQAEGGMNQTASDLLSGLASHYQAYALLSDGKDITLLTFENDELRTVAHASLSKAIVDCRSPHPEYRQFFAEILQEFRIEMVHMHHLLSSCLEICDVLRLFDIPFVLSLHDFFYVCPTVNLLDQDSVYCGGVCTTGDGECLVPFQNLATIPNLKHGWVMEWRDQLSELLDMADAVVAPSRHVAEIYRAAFPNLVDDRITVIEHGRDLESCGDCARSPSPDAPARVLVPGVISRHKGAAYIQQLAMLDHGKRLEFHFLGRIPPELEGVGVEHGPYEVSEFPDRARDIGPAFVALFSITAETYGHVMTEAWACGVPMLVLDIGTQADRVVSKGGGWVLDRDDVNAAYRKILKICDHPEDYASQRELASLDGIPDVTAMAKQYDLMYRRVRLARRNFQPLSCKPSARPKVDRPLKIAILPQRDDDAPISSSFIRLTLPLEHSLARPTVDSKTISYLDIITPQECYDAVIIQRAAIANGQARCFIDECRARQLPYILDIDDDLLSMDQAHAERQSYKIAKNDFEALIEGAAKITLSTDVLAARYESVGEKISVIPNALDEKTWFSPLTSPARVRDYDGIGLLYMGTETHTDDMKVLNTALERLRSSSKVPAIRLFVIGGEPAQAGQDWYTRIDVPLGCRRYPEFVSWLRDYREYWDIGLAPLVDTMFNGAKSNLKYLEYSALGLPGIYSTLPPFTETVRPRRTGLLAGATPESWSAAIDTLAVSSELRRDIADAARTDILENHRLGDVAERFADEIANTVTTYRMALLAK